MNHRRYYQPKNRNTMGALIFLGFILAGVLGWFLNIYKLIAVCDYDTTNSSLKCEVVRGIGVPVAPLGAVVGWMDLGK